MFPASSPQLHRQQQPQLTPTDHVYAVPAVVREEEEEEVEASSTTTQVDESVLSRIRRETEMKEEFLRRPVGAAAASPKMQNQQQHQVATATNQNELSSKRSVGINSDSHKRSADIWTKSFSSRQPTHRF